MNLELNSEKRHCRSEEVTSNEPTNYKWRLNHWEYPEIQILDETFLYLCEALSSMHDSYLQLVIFWHNIYK